jgi:thioredoxin reductase (NADPH)
LKDSQGKLTKITAKNVIIAVGCRPKYLEHPPDLHDICITSDDLFSLERNPGKTLVIGAGYIGLECGGFINNLGCDVTVLIRSEPLRGYDQEMALRLVDSMEAQGVKFHRNANLKSAKRLESGRIHAVYEGDGQVIEGEFDTLLLAIGRMPETKGLGLDRVGAKLGQSGKILANEFDETTAPNLFAIGDCAEGRPEFTPTAILSGKLLARRLAGKSTDKIDYANMGCTVFTPLEYGCIGLSEAAAMEAYGKDEVVVYHTDFKPAEWEFLSYRKTESCFGKLVITKSNGRVVGFHYLGPNAGEVTQGYVVAMKIGATLLDFEGTLGIQSTCSEEMLKIMLKNCRPGQKESPIRPVKVDPGSGEAKNKVEEHKAADVKGFSVGVHEEDCKCAGHPVVSKCSE